jgi:uncharacterized coiled-coil protein SlyX
MLIQLQELTTVSNQLRDFTSLQQDDIEKLNQTCRDQASDINSLNEQLKCLNEQNEALNQKVK